MRTCRSLKSQSDNLKIDKSSLLELLRLSHVTTTKEPCDWDWRRITDIWKGHLHNPAALTETLLHTKFLKRLGGFFRCDPGEKGYYGHLSWTPQNCSLYNRVASQMMRVLLCSSDDMDGYYMGGKIRSSTRSEAPFISRPTSPTLNTPRVEGSQGVSKTMIWREEGVAI